MRRYGITLGIIFCMFISGCTDGGKQKMQLPFPEGTFRTIAELVINTKISETASNLVQVKLIADIPDSKLNIMDVLWLTDSQVAVTFKNPDNDNFSAAVYDLENNKWSKIVFLPETLNKDDVGIETFATPKGDYAIAVTKSEKRQTRMGEIVVWKISSAMQVNFATGAIDPVEDSIFYSIFAERLIIADITEQSRAFPMSPCRIYNLTGQEAQSLQFSEYVDGTKTEDLLPIGSDLKMDDIGKSYGLILTALPSDYESCGKLLLLDYEQDKPVLAVISRFGLIGFENQYPSDTQIDNFVYNHKYKSAAFFYREQIYGSSDKYEMMKCETLKVYMPNKPVLTIDWSAHIRNKDKAATASSTGINEQKADQTDDNTELSDCAMCWSPSSTKLIYSKGNSLWLADLSQLLM